MSYNLIFRISFSQNLFFEVITNLKYLQRRVSAIESASIKCVLSSNPPPPGLILCNIDNNEPGLNVDAEHFTPPVEPPPYVISV